MRGRPDAAFSLRKAACHSIRIDHNHCENALAVETYTRAYGEREAALLDLPQADADVLIERYTVTGLLHNFDYERHPLARGAPVRLRPHPCRAGLA